MALMVQRTFSTSCQSTWETVPSWHSRCWAQMVFSPRLAADGVNVWAVQHHPHCTPSVASIAVYTNRAQIGTRSEVRINGVVHLRTVLPADTTVPIGWVAVGDPAEILPPGEHNRIWALQQPLDFPGTVFGLRPAPPGETIMPELTRRYARFLGRHRDDRVLDAG